MGHMSDAELRAAFRQAVERAEQSPGEHYLCRMTQRMQSTACHSPGLQSPSAGPCQLMCLKTCSSSEVHVLAGLNEGGHHLHVQHSRHAQSSSGAALLD